MKAENKELTVRDPSQYELSTQDVIAQVGKIQAIMKAAMKEGEHYGVIPGTQKPTLLKPGAEKLCLTFRLDPQYESTETMQGDHLTVKTKCTLYHIITGMRMGSGEGSCSTKESKYAFRDAKRKCPVCGYEAIIKGKEEYGGGWLCFRKQGGCGQKFEDGDEEIEGQTIGKVANENLADQYNTVLKMANKRALVAATLNVTAASDIFTQDMEDQHDQKGKNGDSGLSSSAPVTGSVAKGEKTSKILGKETEHREPGDDSPDLLHSCPIHNVAWKNGKWGRFHTTPDKETCGLKKILSSMIGGYCKQLGLDDEMALQDWLGEHQFAAWKELPEESKVQAVDLMAQEAAEKLDKDDVP